MESKRNIDSIKTQDTPFIVEIIGSEYNERYKRKYGTDISVAEGCSVTVNPTSWQTISLYLSSGNIIQFLNVLENQPDTDKSDGRLVNI
jgi:hypothetical protein